LAGARMIRFLIKVTAWEKVSLGRRLLCAFGRVSLLVVLLAAIAYVSYTNRYSIEAKVWHWKHGTSATMGNYEVPVPERWLLNQDWAGFTLINTSPTRPPRDGKFHIAPVINVFPFEKWPADARRLDFWLSLQRQRLAREDVEGIQEKTVQFGDESITCIGGRELSAIFRNASSVRLPETDIISLDCMSGRGLNVLFVGEPWDVEAFYGFLSHIRSQR